MPKESRLSLRITDDMNSKIEHHIAKGKFANRTDFGMYAVEGLLKVLEKEEDDITVLFDVVSHLMIHTRLPVHVVPAELEAKFKKAFADRRGW